MYENDFVAMDIYMSLKKAENMLFENEDTDNNETNIITQNVKNLHKI